MRAMDFYAFRQPGMFGGEIPAPTDTRPTVACRPSSAAEDSEKGRHIITLAVK